MMPEDSSPSPRTAALTALCRSCGLCCDGSLFGRVPLEAEEAPVARKRGLLVLDDGRAFEQPCAALATAGGDRTCAAYADRPAACRRFVCRLYARHRDEGGPLAPRLAAVARVKDLLAAVARDRSAPGRAELERRLDEDFARQGT